MTKGRKPKPTHLKLVEGNPGRRPLNEAEAKPPAALPEPPAELNADAVAEWDRVSQVLYDMGLLSDLDRGALGAYCQSYGLWAQAERALATMAAADAVFGGLMVKTPSGCPIQNPLVGIANKAKADMVRYAAEFGMTPSARSRINATPPDKEKDPAAEFFAA